MPKPLHDVRVILEVLQDARVRNLPVAAAAQDRLARNLAALRLQRDAIRECRFRSPAIAAGRERICRRILTDNRRVKRLIKTYASWRAPLAAIDSPCT